MINTGRIKYSATGDISLVKKECVCFFSCLVYSECMILIGKYVVQNILDGPIVINSKLHKHTNSLELIVIFKTPFDVKTMLNFVITWYLYVHCILAANMPYDKMALLTYAVW